MSFDLQCPRVGVGADCRRNLVNSNAPGIYTDAQIQGWRNVTDRVHAKGGFIYLQLFHFGRGANPDVVGPKGHRIVGPSAVPIEEGAPTPVALTVDEIQGVVRDFAQAAKNAIDGAGFDGVELHGANGYCTSVA